MENPNFFLRNSIMPLKEHSGFIEFSLLQAKPAIIGSR